MRQLRFLAAAAAGALSLESWAAEKTAAAGAVSAGGPYSDAATLAGIAEWFVSSVFVVALIFLCAYLAKKLKLVPSAKAGAPKVLQVLPLGGKHKIAAVEIMNRVLIVGITPSGMSLLAGPFEPEDSKAGGKDGEGSDTGSPLPEKERQDRPSFRSVLESFSGGRNGGQQGSGNGAGQQEQ